jgi:hypothetical protein
MLKSLTKNLFKPISNSSSFHTTTFPLEKKARVYSGTPKNPQIIHNTFGMERNATYSSPSFFTGTVVSTKMQKTAVLLIDRFYLHPKYKIVIRKTKKLL